MSSRVPSRPPSPFANDPRPIAAVFRSSIFNRSETFVAAQAAGLVRYQALVVGLEDKGNVPPSLAGRVMLPERPAERAAIRLLHRWGAFGKRVREMGPGLVHAHFGPDGALALPLARVLGVPLVTSLRGYDVTRSTRALLLAPRLSWIRYVLDRPRLMREGAMFLAVSDCLRRQAVAQGYPAARTFTHYNGVDLARFAAPRDDDGATILHVGRLVEKKGTAVLLRAFAAVRSAHPEAKLAIVGEGPLERRLRRLAGTLGIADAVLFMGYQAPAAVAGYMARAALLAAPSLTASDGDAEGLPNVVVEAAAAGLPVVASDHQGIPEALADGKSGLLVPEGEAKPLAARIGALLASAELRAAMGAAGRALAREKFDSAVQMRLLEMRYDWLTSTKAIETL
jgi:glycosyltransferase involved in cell wall biosynthesis